MVHDPSLCEHLIIAPKGVENIREPKGNGAVKAVDTFEFEFYAKLSRDFNGFLK